MLIERPKKFGLLGCRQSRHLSRNQDFDLLRQRNKQTSSISLKASKPGQYFASQSRLRRRGISSPCIAVFLAWSEFRLRIPLGKRFVSQTLPHCKNKIAQKNSKWQRDEMFRLCGTRRFRKLNMTKCGRVSFWASNFPSENELCSPYRVLIVEESYKPK